MTKVINLFGGPGIGKSSTAAGIFHKLKFAGISCELVTEYAKDLVWETNYDLLENSLHILAEQNRRQRRLRGKVDFIITDSPLILPAVYHKESKTSLHMNDLCWKEFSSYDNYNFLLLRNKPYVNQGRTQTEETAIELDGRIKWYLDSYGVSYTEIIGRESSAHLIAAFLEQRLP